MLIEENKKEMMRMLSEDVRAHRTVLPPAIPADHPLVRLQAETQPPGHVHLRCATHPEESGGGLLQNHGAGPDLVEL
ncbi:hypothetical protein [Streptomyces tubercidicus]|uniref:hypothetical protein n=1 Tax=Streptomyces tubercidicus TaxID=47759 RepID=UPI0037BC9A61